MAQMQLREAIRAAMVEEMERDENVFLMGEEVAEYDVTRPPSEYAVFQLAVHTWKNKRQITNWNRIIVWNVDCVGQIPVRILRKGSKVEVTGTPSTFTFWDEDEEEQVTIDQIEASNVRILQLK